MLAQPDLGAVEPAHRAFEAEQLGIDDEGERHVAFGGVGLDRGVALHELDEVAPVHLDHVVHLDSGHLDGHQHLDRP